MDTLVDRYPNITEKIFNFLDPYEILDYKLVCKSWNSVLGNRFWLRKLKKIGQPDSVTNEWLKIIDRAEELQIHIEGLSRILALTPSPIFRQNYQYAHVNTQSWHTPGVLQMCPLKSLVKYFGSTMTIAPSREVQS